MLQLLYSFVQCALNRIQLAFVVMQYYLVFVINYVMQQICIDKVIIMQSFIIKPEMIECYM